MNVRKIARNGKAWFFVIGVSGVALFKIFGYAEHPERLKAVETGLVEEVVERKDSVGELADTVKDYILTQNILQKGREKARIAKERAEDKKEELLHKWIDAITNK